MRKSLSLQLAALAIVLSLSSCSEGVSIGRSSEGASALNYLNGCLELSLDAQVKDVVKATEKAFESLKISKVSSSSTELCADFEGRTANDSKVKVVIDAAGPNRSSISIHVGFFGSEEESMKIYNEIRRQLGEPVEKKK